MSVHTHSADEHESAYSGLLENDAHWAFGTGFTDPLAGLDDAVPEGVDADDLAVWCLMLGDDALVLAQRLAEWCSRAPDLEEDIALANVALDLLGQARLLLSRAAVVDPSLVPSLPADSPVPPEDRLAFFRDDRDFRNLLLMEAPRGDFAETIARLLLASTWRLSVMQHLTGHADPVLSAIASKAIKELAYHRDFAGRWFVTLALGTEESRRRLGAGITEVWRHRAELDVVHPVQQRLGLPVGEVDDVLTEVFTAAELELPPTPPARPETGRDGAHTEALSRLLAEMQVVARAHPEGRW